MAEAWEPEELAAAAALDEQIDRALTGAPDHSIDHTVLWLATSLRADPPPTLARRVADEHERRERARWRPAQIAAAALAALFLTNGVGSLVNGAWVAEGLGEHYSPHAYVEGGLALITAGVIVAAGLFRRSWLPLSTLAGSPLGLALGIRGIPEVGQFAPGAVLHLSEGAVGLALAVLWWRARYRRAPGDEGGA